MLSYNDTLPVPRSIVLSNHSPRDFYVAMHIENLLGDREAGEKCVKGTDGLGERRSETNGAERGGRRGIDIDINSYALDDTLLSLVLARSISDDNRSSRNPTLTGVNFNHVFPNVCRHSRCRPARNRGGRNLRRSSREYLSGTETIGVPHSRAVIRMRSGRAAVVLKQLNYNVYSVWTNEECSRGLDFNPFGTNMSVGINGECS